MNKYPTTTRESLEAAEHIRRDGGQQSGRRGYGDSLGSTWNQSNFAFMQEDEMKEVVGRVGGAEGDQARTQALNSLLHTQVPSRIH